MTANDLLRENVCGVCHQFTDLQTVELANDNAQVVGNTLLLQYGVHVVSIHDGGKGCMPLKSYLW